MKSKTCLFFSTFFLVFALHNCKANDTIWSPNHFYYSKVMKDNELIVIGSKDRKFNRNIYGHPLGASYPVGWPNDSILIINSGCCEGEWFFKYNVKKNTISRYSNQDIEYKKEHKSDEIFDKKGIEALFKYLERNFKLISIQSDSLFTNTNK